MKPFLYSTVLFVSLFLTACIVPEPQWTESAGRNVESSAAFLKDQQRPYPSQATPSKPEEPTAPPPSDNVKVYRVYNAEPDEIIDVIKIMVPDAENLTIQTAGKKLVAKGSAEQHRIIREMLRELDTPPQNVRIDVQFNTTARNSAREAGIQQTGPIIINNNGISGSAEVRLNHQNTSRRENVTQSLVASSGHHASLHVGETVPYLTWLHEYGRRWGYIRETEIEWQDVGSFLVMEPTILGNSLIRIRLTPELSGRLKNGERQTIQFTRVATEIIVKDGATVSIGGFSENKEFYSKFLIGRSHNENSTITDITLTPSILEW